MNSTRIRRRRNCTTADRRPTIAVALDTIPLCPYDSNQIIDVPLADIEIVRPTPDGSVDIIYKARRSLNSDLTADEIRSGYTPIDQILIALGWQPGMSHNGNLGYFITAGLDRQCSCAP